METERKVNKMKLKFKSYYKRDLENIENWSKNHLAGLFIFNILIISLLLLKSGGYFYPYFTITINTVVFIGFVGSIFLLGAKSKTLFLISLFFWAFAAFMRTIGIEVWAERISIYTFQAMLLGVILVFIEVLRKSPD